MSYPPQHPYDQQQPPVGPSFPPPKNRKRLWMILAAALALVVVMAGTVVFTLAAVGKDGGAPPTRSQAVAGDSQVGEDPTPTTPAPVVTPELKDFELRPKITDKECFGSAGCNVVFRVDLTYNGPSPMDEETTWLVTYEVGGIEDGPAIGSLELTGGTFTADTEMVQTRSTKSRVTLKVTDVSKAGV